MSTTSTPQSESFNEAYLKLTEAADRLANTEEFDIDGLLDTVRTATESAAICKRRLQAVEEALTTLLGDMQDDQA